MQWTEPAVNPNRVPLAFPVVFFIGVSGYDSAAEFSLVVTVRSFGLCPPLRV